MSGGGGSDSTHTYIHAPRSRGAHHLRTTEKIALVKS